MVAITSSCAHRSSFPGLTVAVSAVTGRFSLFQVFSPPFRIDVLAPSPTASSVRYTRVIDCTPLLLRYSTMRESLAIPTPESVFCSWSMGGNSSISLPISIGVLS